MCRHLRASSSVMSSRGKGRTTPNLTGMLAKFAGDFRVVAIYKYCAICKYCFMVRKPDIVCVYHQHAVNSAEPPFPAGCTDIGR